MTRLTVILPFHVENFFLHQAIRSTLLAMSEDDELILINTSNSKFSNPHHHNNVSVVDSPGSHYIPALSLGISLAVGKYIALMNSDDLVSIRRFEKQINQLDSDRSDLAFSGVQKFTGRSRKIFPILGDVSSNQYWPGLLLLGSYGANASWLFRRTWAKDIELFSSKLDTSDWTTALRVLPDSRISYLPEKLYFYRMHKDQVTRTNPEKHATLGETWSNFNERLKLPMLSKNEIRILILPKLGKVEKVELKNIVNWSNEFRNLIPPNSGNDSLLRRRLVILKSVHPFETATNFDLPIMLRMLAELSWNFSKPRI